MTSRTLILLVVIIALSSAEIRQNNVCSNFRRNCIDWALNGWCDVTTYWTKYSCCFSCHRESTGCPNGQTRNHKGDCQAINFCGTIPKHQRCKKGQICVNKPGGYMCGTCKAGYLWNKELKKCVGTTNVIASSSTSTDAAVPTTTSVIASTSTDAAAPTTTNVIASRSTDAAAPTTTNVIASSSTDAAAPTTTETTRSPVKIEDCPKTWTKDQYLQVFGTFCFRFMVRAAPWMSAKITCELNSGILAMPKTLEINEFLTNQLLAQYKVKNFLHIGLEKTPGKGTNYTWLDDTPLEGSWQNWQPGRRQQSNCVALDTRKNGTWSEIPSCNQGYGFFVCQYSP